MRNQVRAVVIGGGVVGINSAKIAAGMGAHVTILDISLDRLRYLDDVLPKNVDTVYSNRHNILEAIAKAAGGSLRHAVRVTVFLTDLAHFAKVNEVMAQYIPQPWPARAALGVSQLPKGARVEVDCILHLD